MSPLRYIHHIRTTQTASGTGRLLMVLRDLRCRLTGHQCRTWAVRRVSATEVQCHCSRCGKLLTAEYGLQLPLAPDPSPHGRTR